MYPKPPYVDGRKAVVDLSVYCYNTGTVYMTYDGAPDLGGQQTKITNSDKVGIGSVTYADLRAGSLNLQYNLETDENPSSVAEVQVGYIVSFRQRYFVVGKVSPKIVKNDAIKFSVDVMELAAPFIAILLSLNGQQLQATHAASSSYTVNCVASGTRTGAVIAYSIETFATPGSAAPAGFTISSSTGVLTVNAVAGTYDIRVIATDTVTLADGTTSVVQGFGRYTVVLS